MSDAKLFGMVDGLIARDLSDDDEARRATIEHLSSLDRTGRRDVYATFARRLLAGDVADAGVAEAKPLIEWLGKQGD